MFLGVFNDAVSNVVQMPVIASHSHYVSGIFEVVVA